MMRPDDILAMPRHARTRLKLAEKPRKYSVEDRGPFDRQELLGRLREAGETSWRKYEGVRRSGDPTVNDYRKEFGSWKNAIRAAFGKDPIVVSELDHKYIYKTINEFNLRTFKDYLRARELRPDVLPSKHRLLAKWGTWSNVKVCAKRASTAQTVSDYIKLWRRLGCKPKRQDCKDVGLVIDGALKFYGSKKEMDIAVTAMRRHE